MPNRDSARWTWQILPSGSRVCLNTTWLSAGETCQGGRTSTTFSSSTVFCSREKVAVTISSNSSTELVLAIDVSIRMRYRFTERFSLFNDQVFLIRTPRHLSREICHHDDIFSFFRFSLVFVLGTAESIRPRLLGGNQ